MNKVSITDFIIKSEKDQYDEYLLEFMKNDIITLIEYNKMKELYNNLSLTNILCFKNILKKINDKKFNDLTNKLFNQNSILFFSIDDIIKKFYENEKSMIFTKDQKKSIKNIFYFLYEQDNLYLLEGYAGTGKTYLIAKIVRFLLENNFIKSIALSAPTNKAVNILSDKFNDGLKIDNNSINVDFLTIHKLLKYNIDYNIDGKIMFIKKKGSIFNLYDVIIVDECSMLDRKITSDIIKETINTSIKIIFVGDPAQLPPVKEIKSQIFNLGIKKNIMMDVVRTENESIVGICNNVRKWLFNEISNPNLKKFSNKGVFLYKNKSNNNNFFSYIKNSKWFKSFLKDILKKNSNTIILAWTNKRVEMYNNEIRKILFNKNKLKRFEIGDRLLLNNFYRIYENENIECLYTSEQIEILNIKKELCQFQILNIDYQDSDYIKKIKNLHSIKKITDKTIEQINKNTSRNYYIYILTVKKCQKKWNNKFYKIKVIRKKSLDNWENDKNYAIEKLNDLIKWYQIIQPKNISIIQNSIIKFLWKEFNDVFINPFASVNYGFSSTVHKSQATSYENVYIDIDDILSNKKIEESKKCVYTAMTRAIKNIHLLI